jgi:S1-C subfamily serine protease
MLLTAACLVASVIIPDGASVKSVADRMHGTVVQVRGSAGDTATYATGVLVGPRLAVTALHAVAARVTQEGLTPLPHVDVLLQGKPLSTAEIVGADAELDLALLRLPDDVPALPYAPFAADDPTEGQLLIAMGADEDAIRVIDVTIAQVHGNFYAVGSRHAVDSRFWGGPLFDRSGRLAAIELTALGEPRAVPARVIKAWIDRTTARN